MQKLGIKLLAKISLVSLLLPFLVFVLLVTLFNLSQEMGSETLASVLNNLLTYFYLLPLHVVNWTGMMGNNPEGIYNQWASFTTWTFLAFQSLVVFYLLLRKKKKHIQSSHTTPASAPR